MISRKALALVLFVPLMGCRVFRPNSPAVIQDRYSSLMATWRLKSAAEREEMLLRDVFPSPGLREILFRELASRPVLVPASVGRVVAPGATTKVEVVARCESETASWVDEGAAHVSTDRVDLDHGADIHVMGADPAAPLQKFSEAALASAIARLSRVLPGDVVTIVELDLTGGPSERINVSVAWDPGFAGVVELSGAKHEVRQAVPDPMASGAAFFMVATEGVTLALEPSADRTIRATLRAPGKSVPDSNAAVASCFLLIEREDGTIMQMIKAMPSELKFQVRPNGEGPTWVRSLPSALLKNARAVWFVALADSGAPIVGRTSWPVRR